MAIEFVGFDKRGSLVSVDAPEKLNGQGSVSFFFDNWRFAFRCEQKLMRESILTVLITEGAEEFKNLADMEQTCSVQLDQPFSSENPFADSRVLNATITRIEKLRDGLEVEFHTQTAR